MHFTVIKSAAAPDLLAAAKGVDEWHDLIRQNYPEMYRQFKTLRSILIETREYIADARQTDGIISRQAAGRSYWSGEEFNQPSVNGIRHTPRAEGAE